MNCKGLGVLLACMCLLSWLAQSQAAEDLAQPDHGRAVAPRKLFPQITEGIVNAQGQLVMNCQIGSDGLTVTDRAWNTYLPKGKAKRWSVNQTPYTDRPLADYRFDKKFAGLQVNITVEIFDPANVWNVLETYQETLQLGGVAEDLPAWFKVPQNRLAYDFDEGTWFPAGWQLPRGKFACWEGAAKYDQKDRNGRHPMLDFGFTQVAENTLSFGGHVPDWEHQCRVFGDAEWLQMGDGGNFQKWHNDGWKQRGERMKIVIPDFENGDQWKWSPQHYDAFRAMVVDFKKARPNCLFGCWGVGVTKASLRIFDHFDDQGRPTGSVHLQAAKQWRDKYDRPEKELNPIFDRCEMTFGNPSVYWINGGNPAHLYAVVQEWEVGKLARPNVPNVMSTWIQSEFVDKYPLSMYRFRKPDGTYQVCGLKHQAPPSFVYAMSLFAHCRMDGAYCWETGSMYSEDVADAGKAGEGGMQTPVRKTVHGEWKDVVYYTKYFGFYNYHVLGMWQASRNKDIIEASTQWFMPEFRTTTGGVWRTGDERYPSYCNFYKEPLIRAKKSDDGSEWLVIACNPYNAGVQKVSLRSAEVTAPMEFDLIGDYPTIKRFRVKQTVSTAETGRVKGAGVGDLDRTAKRR